MKVLFVLAKKRWNTRRLRAMRPAYQLHPPPPHNAVVEVGVFLSESLGNSPKRLRQLVGPAAWWVEHGVIGDERVTGWRRPIE